MSLCGRAVLWEGDPRLKSIVLSLFGVLQGSGWQTGYLGTVRHCVSVVPAVCWVLSVSLGDGL